MNKLILCAVLAMSNAAFAGNINAIPSCYNKKIQLPNKTTETEIFLIIDQTTLFNTSLQQSVANNVRLFLKPNHAFSVTQFSAFTQGHYTDVLVSGKLQPVINEEMRDDISKPLLSKLDQCLAMQSSLSMKQVGKAMRSAFSGSSSTLTNSDILASLKDISSKVRQSKSDNKVVFVASDMLEHSSLTSFYSKQSVRLINASKELKIATDNDMLADFDGAKVYIIGAGLLAEDSKQPKGIYRSPQTMQSLAKFWKDWFKVSNGELIEFGQPALLSTIY